MEITKVFKRSGQCAILPSAVYVLTTLSLGASSDIHAQQFSDWSEPINLGPAINTEFNERLAGIAPNGLSLYFTSDRPGGYGDWDIYVSQRSNIGDPWREPQNLGSIINSKFAERAPNFSPCGHWMYLNSDRPGGCGSFDIYVSYRKDINDDFGWQSPLNLGCAMNTPYEEGGASFFMDPNTGVVGLYITSIRPEGVGDPDIYWSARRSSGVFGRAALVWELSTTYDEGRTAIRADGLEIFFHSNRPGGVGDFDLWSSRRETPQDAWSSPENLGKVVNSPYRDGEPALSFDGTELYFNSTKPGGLGARDLYVSKRTILNH